MSAGGGRLERDALGPVTVPHERLWGASTQRALANFPRTALPMHPALIIALARVKLAAARANAALGELPEPLAAQIARAAGEIIDGRLGMEHFPVDVFQTGSGTSTNTNLNEVIANRCAQLAQRPLGAKDPVHPNDHVNRGQSSNDVFPTATQLAALELTARRLDPALAALERGLRARAVAFADVIALGRTHLQDATPVTMGQRANGWAAQVAQARERLAAARPPLCELPLGGTAVGTGLNAHPGFAAAAIVELAALTGEPLVEARDHFAAQGARDAVVAFSGQVRTTAVALTRIANDLRLLASGPRGGLGELVLPTLQPGSSIMPGKVNPVAAEAAIQLCLQAVADDQAVALAGLGGLGSLLELNVAMPLMARNLLEAIDLVAAAATVLADKAVAGLEVDRARCAELVERSLALVTPLARVLGYDRAAAIAQRAWRDGTTLRDAARAEGVAEDMLTALDPRGMIGPAPDRG